MAGASRRLSTSGLSTSVNDMRWAEWAGAVEIEPSIYASDFSRLGAQLEALSAAGANVFHFDVGDGHLIPEITVGPVVLASISPLVRGWGGRLDCHLMVSEPERHFEAIAKAGGDSVTFHVEACDDPGRAIAHARSLDLGVGVALNPETAVEDAVAAADGVDLVLCMSIHPGYPGRRSCPTRSIASRSFARCFLHRRGSRSTAGSTWRRSSPRATPVRISSSRAVPCSGATIPRRPTVSSPRWSLMVELLEVRDAEHAFARLEAWLRDRGFFVPGGEHLVADLFLGYGLSRTLRRGASAPPPEPCPALPLAACIVRDEDALVRQSHKGFEIGAWEQSWTAAEYRDAVEDVRDAIARGDVYQVNLVQHLQAPFAAIRGRSPRDSRRFARCIAIRSSTDRWAVVSASPELFLARRGERIRTMPIKGTRPLGESAELRASEKDAAEHVMIVDLERNDLSRVCVAGSVRWPELMTTRELAGVEHMVSTVEGTLRPDAGLADILEATFPGGSVTGAPKIAAVDLVAELEPVGRGAAMGALGRVYGNGDFELALRPHVRGRRRLDPPLGRWRRRVGLGPRGRGRGVVDEGGTTARGHRVAGAGGGAP